MTWVANYRLSNKSSPSSHRFVLRSTFESSQVALKRLFSRRLSVRSEPAFEVPDPNLVLDLGLLDGDRNRRILMDTVDPIVLTKNVQFTSYSFKETARRDFDSMLHDGTKNNSRRELARYLVAMRTSDDDSTQRSGSQGRS